MYCECHGHVVLDGVDWKRALERHKNAPDEAWIRRVLAKMRDAGIAYYRDGGDNLGVSERARELSGEYGIDFVTPCFAIHKNGCYGKMVGLGWDTLADYRALIREAKRRRADFIKIMISGIISYDEFGLVAGGGPDADEIGELIKIAHGEGFSVMAHGNTPQAVLPALKAGVDSIEHGFYIDAECVAAMAETGAVWTPTLSTATVLIDRSPHDPELLARIVDAHSRNIAAASAAGALIASGSDAGAHLLYHGDAIIEELKALETAGCGEAEIERGNAAIRARFKYGGRN